MVVWGNKGSVGKLDYGGVVVHITWEGGGAVWSG